MRKTFSTLITEAAKADKRIVLLTGDHGYALFDEFRSTCPDQYINCGVAEQNMVGVAAGLAKSGLRPMVYGLSAFVPMRVLEQIKIDVCYQSLPVMLIGDGAGVVYSHLGSSHQCTEDIAALRAIPHIDIVSPADRFELSYCFASMLKSGKPSYLRFGKADLGDIHTRIPSAPMGDLLPVHEGKADCIMLATGSMVSTAIKVAADIGDIQVWSVPAITAINREQLLKICKSARKIVTLEEHSVHGGMGGMIAETLSEAGKGGVIRLGMNGKFSEPCGTYAYLMEWHGLDAKAVKQAVLKALG